MARRHIRTGMSPQCGRWYAGVSTEQPAAPLPDDSSACVVARQPSFGAPIDITTLLACNLRGYVRTTGTNMPKSLPGLCVNTHKTVFAGARGRSSFGNGPHLSLYFPDGSGNNGRIRPGVRREAPRGQRGGLRGGPGRSFPQVRENAATLRDNPAHPGRPTALPVATVRRRSAPRPRGVLVARRGFMFRSFRVGRPQSAPAVLTEAAERLDILLVDGGGIGKRGHGAIDAGLAQQVQHRVR